MATKDKEKLPEFVPPEGTLGKDTLDHCFFLEVVKDKEAIGKQPLSGRPFHVFGRSDQVHIPVIHPSLSRQHAVVLHTMVGKEGEDKKPGIAVMDLGSANATHINGKKIKAKIVYPIKPGYFFTLGKSSRRYYLRHDPSLPKPKEKKKSAQVTKVGEKRKIVEEGPQGDKVAKRKLSADEIKKLKAKKNRQVTSSIGARKLVASQFRSLVEMPRTAPQGLAVTLEDMASTPVESKDAEKVHEEEEAEEVVEEGEDPDGDDPDTIDEGRSWLIKPESAIARDEDSD